LLGGWLRGEVSVLAELKSRGVVGRIMVLR
jgi:hypothetical protein